MQTNTLPQNHMEIYWHDYASQMENIPLSDEPVLCFYPAEQEPGEFVAL